MGSAVSDILLCILAIIIPPLPVFLKRGCGGHLLLNVLLCIFGLWIGGIIHAIYVICATSGEAH